MTDTNSTEIICVIDRSGSMAQIRDDAIGGFNTFLAEQQKLPGQAKLTLVLFDHEFQVLHDGVDIQQVRELNHQTYTPRGTTALLDAIGHSMDLVGKRLEQIPEQQRPATVVMAILTDGQENSSKGYSHDQISSMIKHQKEVYAWEFVFLAADQEAFAVACRRLGTLREPERFAGWVRGICRNVSRKMARVAARQTMAEASAGAGGRCQVFWKTIASCLTCAAVTTISSRGAASARSRVRPKRTKTAPPRSRKWTSGSLGRPTMARPVPYPPGVYQIGEVYARSWVVILQPLGILMLKRKASYAVQRGVGISRTRA